MDYALATERLSLHVTLSEQWLRSSPTELWPEVRLQRPVNLLVNVRALAAHGWAALGAETDLLS